MKRLLASILILPMLVLPVRAESIKWVDFNVSCESMKYALEQDIATFEQEKHISWIDILALAACRTGGKCGLASVKQAVSDLKKDESPEQLLGDLYKYYDYYHRAYTAVLGGLVGSYAIEKDGQWVATYGLKAFSPIAAGYGYSHCDDFGVARSFGFRRKHLGNDLMGALGTPVVAVEGGVVEAMGWNRYGGWRVGIRSFDSRRYYYITPICRRIRPLPRGLPRGTPCRRGMSSASWAEPAIPTRKMSTTSRRCICISAWNWYSTRARRNVIRRYGSMSTTLSGCCPVTGAAFSGQKAAGAGYIPIRIWTGKNIPRCSHKKRDAESSASRIF